MKDVSKFFWMRTFSGAENKTLKENSWFASLLKYLGGSDCFSVFLCFCHCVSAFLLGSPIYDRLKRPYLEEVLKSLWKATWKYILNTSWRMENCCAEDVFFQAVFNTSSLRRKFAGFPERLGKQEMFAGKRFRLYLTIYFIFGW